MSYILEALKKAEKERQKESVPDLQANHTPSLVTGGGKRGRNLQGNIWVVIALLVVAIPAGLFLLRDKALEPIVLETPIQPESTSGTRTQPLQERTLPEKVAKIPVIEKQVLQPEQVTIEPRPLLAVDHQDIKKDSLEIPARKQQAFTIPQLPSIEELPAHIKDQLPELNFAAHTYSDLPAERMIIINNQIMREGRLLGKGLRLEEITWEGVILSSNGTRFTVQAHDG